MINTHQVALFLGQQMKTGIYVQVSLPPTVVIITAYEPDINEWIGNKIRR